MTKTEHNYNKSMNSNDYITETLLNNLVGMRINGREVIEVHSMSNRESFLMEPVLLVRYGEAINDKLFIHPNRVRYSYLTSERIVLVERSSWSEMIEFDFTK